jgi:hypothetical protein
MNGFLTLIKVILNNLEIKNKHLSIMEFIFNYLFCKNSFLMLNLISFIFFN